MQWEAFFHKNNDNLSTICRAGLSTVQFRDAIFHTPDSAQQCQIAQAPRQTASSGRMSMRRIWAATP
jgi:hypothetical protein